MNFYAVIEIIASFLELFFLFCISDLFFEKRIKSKWHIGALLSTCIFETIVITYLNFISLYSYFTVTILIVIATLIIILLHKCSIIQACCLSAMYMVIISSFDFLFLIFVEYVLKSPDFVMAVLTGNCIQRVITLIIAKGSTAIFFLIIKKKKWKLSISNLTSFILIVFSVFTFFCMQYLMQMFFLSELKDAQKIILVAGAFMTLFFSSVLLVLNGREKMLSKAKEQALIETELQITKEHNENIIETYREIAKMSHDFKNQMRVIMIMLKDGKNDEARDYLSGIVESSVHKTTKYTGISSIDTVLSEKKRVATEKNINIDFDVNLPSISGINSTDICTILLNLIDNAIEACLKVENEQDRNIKVILKNANSMVVIKVENSIFETVTIPSSTSLLKTTKEQKNTHGFGLKIVNSVAEKYNGSLVVQQEDNRFTATVLLNNH